MYIKNKTKPYYNIKVKCKYSVLIEILAIISTYLFILFLIKIHAMPHILGINGTTFGHVIHEAGAAALLTRRHAEPLVALLAHKRSEQFSQVKICCL